MRKKGFGYASVVALVSAIGLLGAGCGLEDRETVNAANRPLDAPAPGQLETGTTQVMRVEMVADRMEFIPNELTVRPGQPVRVELENEGTVPHNIEFELPAGEVELQQNVAPGETKVLQFQAPEKPGTYTFYCPVANHEERGMTGKLIVAP